MVKNYGNQIRDGTKFRGVTFPMKDKDIANNFSNHLTERAEKLRNGMRSLNERGMPAHI